MEVFSTVLWQPRDTGSVKIEGNIHIFMQKYFWGSGSTSVSLVSFIWILFIVALTLLLLLTEKNNVATLFPKCNSS